MANTRYIETRYSLNSASESLVVAYWSNPDFHVPNAREAITRALCGGDRATLIDMIENAMDNVHDMDVTFTDYATAVADALLDYAAPLPTPDDEN